ncbi:Rho GTPase activation protein [Powellomyces hirtus]|nr:Rho GTPase activation protein [Powellomyces hirtus]
MKKFLRRFSTTAAPPSVFGSHLDVLVAKDRAAGRTSGDPNVPYIMKKFVKCLSTEEALKTEGLFRVSGSAKLSKDLREKIDKTGTIDLHDVEAHDIPAVASVFKQWLRELPEALVPDTFYAAVEDAAGSVDDLRTVLLTLPPLNFATLSYLCRFIHKISTYSHDNRMPTANLSVVFAPNVFKCPSEPRPGASSTMAGVPQTPVASGDQTGYFAESLVVSKIMTFLLDHVREVFGAVGDWMTSPIS